MYDAYASETSISVIRLQSVGSGRHQVTNWPFWAAQWHRDTTMCSHEYRAQIFRGIEVCAWRALTHACDILGVHTVKICMYRYLSQPVQKQVSHITWKSASFISVAPQPNWGLGSLTVQGSRSHIIHAHTVGHLCTSNQLIAHAAIHKNTTNTRDKPRTQRNSNPWSQQPTGCRRTPYTRRPQGSATGHLQ